MFRRRELVLLLPLACILAYWQWRYAGYVKDDTFISMRYARNLALGHGLVFNYGDKLEGYTNFLWVLLTVPAFWLDVEPLRWVKGMSCLFGQVGLVVTYVTARFLCGAEGRIWALLAAAFWALSPSVILWSMAGLEPTLMAVLASGGTYFAMRAWLREGADNRDPRRDALFSALLLAASALCRPDAHAVILLAGAFVVVDGLRLGRLERHWVLWGAVLLGVLVPYHIGRVLYFGDLFPNTAYVKAAAGPEVYARGMEFARSLLEFAANPAVFTAAVVGVLVPGRRIAKLWAAALALFFLAYMVKIGRDEMKWFRLFLPIFPLVLALAAAGFAGVFARVGRGIGLPSVAVGLLAVAVVIPSLQICWDLAESKARWHSNYVRWSEKSFQQMGRYIQDRSDRGDVVVFQDMGAAPFTGPELRWVDSIGILDRFVAHELARLKLNPFMRREKRKVPGGKEAVREADRNIKNYLFDQDPDWFAFVAYVPKPQRSKFNRGYKRVRKDKEALEKHFLGRIKGNGHAHGVARDKRFREDFRFERVWKRNMGYWLVLYRHRSH